MMFLRGSLAALAFVGLAAASCSGTPSATLPMSGHWQWANANTLHPRSLDQDKVTCFKEAEAIQLRISQCSSPPPSDCNKLEDNVNKAMCQYSNATTKRMCSVGRLEIPKQEIMDGCIAARGWKQVWIKNGG